MNRTACPDLDRIRAWLDESSQDEATSELGQHITVCDRCRDAAERMASSDEGSFAWLRALVADYAPTAPDACQRAIENVRQIAEQSRVRLHGESRLSVRTLTTDRIAQYVLLDEIGQGGMGRVFLATDEQRQARVALKIIAGDHLARVASRARFERETKHLLEVTDKHLVRALDAGTWRGLPWLAMEHLQGIDLANLVRRGGPLSPSDACEVIRQAALGTDVLHRAGLIHRDIKPSNLMLTHDGVVKLLDLGLARMVASEDWSDDLTATGHVLGSIRYMAPEQFTNPRDAGPVADLYSLGCTLWWLLTGRTPFGDDAVETPWQVMQAHQAGELPDIRSLVGHAPPELAELLARLLAKSPAERLADAAELAAQLAPLCPIDAAERLAKLVPTEREQLEPDGESPAMSPRSFVLSVPIGDDDPTEVLTPATVPRTQRGVLSRFTIGAVVCILAAIPLARTFLADKLNSTNSSPSTQQADGKSAKGRAAENRASEIRAQSNAAVAGNGSDPPEIRIREKAGADMDTASRAARLVELEKLIPAGDTFAWPESKLEIPSDGGSTTAAGEALGARTLVSLPAGLDDVISWTIETRTPRAHLWGAAFSGDGRCYATHDDVGVIRVFDAADDRLLRMFVAGGEVTSLDWSPSGGSLAVGGSDSTFLIIDAASGRPFRRVKMNGGGGKEVRWSPDGVRLAIAIPGGYALYDLKLGISNPIIVAPDEHTRNLDWSRDGKRLAIGCQSGRVLVVNAEDGAVVLDWDWEPKHGGARYITDVGISPDGRWIAAARVDRQIRLREIQPAADEPIERELASHMASFAYRLAWLSNDQIVTSDGVSLRWFQPDSDQPVRVKPNPLQFAGPKHGGIILSRFAVSPDGQQIACPLRFERRVWRLDLAADRDWQPHSALPTIGFSGRLSGSPDGRWLAHSTVPHGVSILDTKTLAEKHRLGIQAGGGVATWSPDGATLAVPTTSGLMIVDQIDQPTARRRVVYDGAVANISWSPDSSRVGVTNHGSTKLTWLDPIDWKPFATVTLPEPGPFFGRGWSTDSRWLALGGNTRVTVLNVESAEAKFSIPQSRQVRGISWHPTEPLMAVVAQDSVVRIVRLDDGSAEEFARHSGVANDLLWSTDGKQLNVLFDGELERRSWPDGELIWSVPLAGHSVQSLVESPDGARLTVACHSELHLFRTTDGQPLGNRVALGPDDWVFIAPTGETVGSPGYENWLLAVIETAQGQQAMPLGEFAERFGWSGGKVTAD